MAVNVILRVGDTSAQDISLTSAGVAVLDYPMNAPDVNQAAIQNLGDGNGLSVPNWSNVTESLELHISAATAALVADKIRAIERLLNLARQGTEGYLDDKLYLRIQFDHDSAAWRSQILAAKLELPQGSDLIWRNYVTATLIITRRYYWEMETIQAIAMTSGPTPTPTTGYVTVYNADDTHATNRNWWQIAADQVGGSIPAPAKLYIKNASGATRAASTFFIGNYVFCAPDTVDPIFRHEDRDDGLLQATTTEGAISMWELDDGNLVNSFKGQFGRVLVVWSSRPESTTLIRAALMYRFPAPEIDLALGDQILSPSVDYVLDLGSIPIPPGRAWANMGDNLYLVVKGLAASGTDAITTDWVQVMPAGAGRYRMIKGITNSLSIDNGNEMIDDGSAGGTYLHVSGGADLPLYLPFFDPIYLWPDKLQRLRFIVSGGASMEPAQAWQVKMEVRPRRLSF